MPPPAGGWSLSSRQEQHRRSLYIAVRRTASYPLMAAFDMPDSHESCARRTQTITAPQALNLLNDKQSLEWAQSLAGRVIQRAGDDPAAQAAEAFRLAYTRAPNAWEKDRVLTFFSQQRKLVSERLSKGEPIAQPTPGSGSVPPDAAAALVDLCLALLNSNEFVYRF